MSYEAEYRVTAEHVRENIRKNYGVEDIEVVFHPGNEREEAFVNFNGSWFRMDLIEDWRPRDAVPGYIPENQIGRFYAWLDADRDKQNRKGRAFGQAAMQKAICGLLGAAQLVELENGDDY